MFFSRIEQNCANFQTYFTFADQRGRKSNKGWRSGPAPTQKHSGYTPCVINEGWKQRGLKHRWQQVTAPQVTVEEFPAFALWVEAIDPPAYTFVDSGMFPCYKHRQQQKTWLDNWGREVAVRGVKKPKRGSKDEWKSKENELLVIYCKAACE